MKLAIIAHPRFPIKSPYAGGLEAFTGALVEYYQSVYDVTLYAHPDSDVNCNLKTFAIDNSLYKQYPDIVENDFMLKVMADISKNNFDVVHNNSLNPIPILWASKHNISMLTTLHTPPYSKLKAVVGLASYSPFIHFTAVSHSLAEVWKPYINDKVDVTYNGIDLKSWQVIKEPKDYVFTYGRILPSKGIDIAISTAQQMNIPIKFAGPIADEQYMDEVIRPLLRPCDSYLGHLEHDSIKHLLANAKAAIFGTRWDEPFGLSTLEAMATGTPVVSFNRGAFAEIVGEGAGILAKGNNVKSLAAALEASFSLDQNDIIKSAYNFPLAKMCSEYSAILGRIA